MWTNQQIFHSLDCYAKLSLWLDLKYTHWHFFFDQYLKLFFSGLIKPPSNTLLVLQMLLQLILHLCREEIRSWMFKRVLREARTESIHEHSFSEHSLCSLWRLVLNYTSPFACGLHSNIGIFKVKKKNLKYHKKVKHYIFKYNKRVKLRMQEKVEQSILNHLRLPD